MPFTYFGSKHGLARYYPPPRYPTIVEPFAGAAGYACRHTPGHHVVLRDASPFIIAIWDEIRDDPENFIRARSAEMRSGTVRHPVPIMLGTISPQIVRGAATRKVTTMMRRNWPPTARRIARVGPHAKTWDIAVGDYTQAPDIEATWFIDPPYVPQATSAGNMYEQQSSGIDYAALAEWCRSRKGQVIVCEAFGADWLPFRPFKRLRTLPTGNGAQRGYMEVIWTKEDR